MIAQTPRGFRDVLPEEAAWREDIRENVCGCLGLWGYMPIETPALEIQDVMQAGGGDFSSCLSLFDSDGRLLCMRPDVTLPIARMVASRLSSDQGPFRFRYCEQVFRNEDDLRAQARANTQLGVESIGLSGPEADAEVLALMLEALQASGLRDFCITVCSVEVLHSLISASGMDASFAEAVLAAFRRSNLVELESLMAMAPIDPAYAAALLQLPNIRGGKEALIRCSEVLAALPGSQDGGDPCADLLRSWEILEASGYADALRVDFSLVSSFQYYTGMIFEAYAPALGMALGGGGRYDHMLDSYGRGFPAAGFAFSLERVMEALNQQGCRPAQRPISRIQVGDDAASAFIQARQMRSGGRRVVLDFPVKRGGE